MSVWSPTGSGNVHIDVALSQVSVAWPNEGLVGNQLFPAVNVKKQSDKYYIFGREAWLPENNDFRAPGTEANEIPGRTVSMDTYYAQEHALQIAVTDEERENADSPFSPDRDGTELVTSKIMLGREVAMKNLATTAANYSTGHSTTLVGTAQWSDFANSDPIGDLRTGKAMVHSKLFLEPNFAIIPYQVMTKLEDHPDFLERIKYSERAIFSQELLQSVLGIAKVVVPGVGIGTSNEGQPISVGYLWGKDVVMAYVPPRPGPRIPAFGYEYVWGNQYVDRWREEKRKSDIIRAQRRYDLKMTAVGDGAVGDAGKQIAGYIIKSAVA
jgi:hypothetical protein